MAVDITPGEGTAVRVFLAPPAFAVITADAITLFDGGDAGRVLWRKPEPAPPETAWHPLAPGVPAPEGAPVPDSDGGLCPACGQRLFYRHGCALNPPGLVCLLGCGWSQDYFGDAARAHPPRKGHPRVTDHDRAPQERVRVLPGL